MSQKTNSEKSIDEKIELIKKTLANFGFGDFDITVWDDEWSIMAGKIGDDYGICIDYHSMGLDTYTFELDGEYEKDDKFEVMYMKLMDALMNN